MRIVVEPDPQAAGRAAATWIATRLRQRAATHGQATLALSGGTTPIPMLAALAEADVPWRRIRIFQVDERVAPNRHPDRNLGLLDVLPIARSQIIPMSVTLPRLEVAVHRYEVWLPERLDVVHLGLGTDGHTASWPPGDDAVVRNPGRVALVGPFNGRMRVTLTPRAVNEARHRILHVTGADRASVIAAYVRGRVEALPVRHVHRTGITLVLDAAAAGQLTSDELGGDD